MLKRYIVREVLNYGSCNYISLVTNKYFQLAVYSNSLICLYAIKVIYE